MSEFRSNDLWQRVEVKIVIDLVPRCRTFAKNTVSPIAITFAILGASGCAINGNSLPQITSGEQLVTSSVAKKAKPEGIEETDAELIKTTVAAASDTATPLAWRNPQTGASGAIVAIDNFQGKHGQKCRGFKTTVANFMGISYYNGETCQVSSEKWVLSWFKASK